MSKRKKAYHAILVIALFVGVLVLSYCTYFLGLFEGIVKYSSFEIGNMDTSLFEYGSNDYTLIVDWESKGAFVAGRKIHISIDFRANQKIDEFRQSELFVIFPGASQFPVPQGFDRILDAHVDLELTDDASAHAEADIIYFMPEPNLEAAMVPWETNGKYTYNLVIDMKPQTSDQLVRKNACLYLAPLETELQLKNNRIVLVLTFFAIYFAIVSVTLTWVVRR